MSLFEYKIIDGDRSSVEESVGRHSADGWTLHGYLVPRVLGTATYYSQAMVRTITRRPTSVDYNAVGESK